MSNVRTFEIKTSDIKTPAETPTGNHVQSMKKPTKIRYTFEDLEDVLRNSDELLEYGYAYTIGTNDTIEKIRNNGKNCQHMPPLSDNSMVFYLHEANMNARCQIAIGNLPDGIVRYLLNEHIYVLFGMQEEQVIKMLQLGYCNATLEYLEKVNACIEVLKNDEFPDEMEMIRTDINDNMDFGDQSDIIKDIIADAGEFVITRITNSSVRFPSIEAVEKGSCHQFVVIRKSHVPIIDAAIRRYYEKSVSKLIDNAIDQAASC